MRFCFLKCCCLSLSRSHRLGGLLGKGNFGKVVEGSLKTDTGEVKVAVKTLKEGSGEEDRVKFLQEAAIMGQFKHPNVVKLHGVVIEDEPVIKCVIIILYMSTLT